jgi:SAM-dependent methyltransferase
MKIDYDHLRNLHTAEGPRAALRTLTEEGCPLSILDVGCGTGTWLRAALDAGVRDVMGIDGIQIPADQLLIPKTVFRLLDLTQPVDLGRPFDLVFCLEVAEHLEECYAETLLSTLVRHSNRIIFSAACPGQPGQHHVNCRWPEWWQKRFNALGYVCDDEIRSKLWDETMVEPWYRQNIFTARKDPAQAFTEPRLKSVVHPAMLPCMISTAATAAREEAVRNIEKGCMPVSWYVETSGKALNSKIRRGMHPRHR